MTNQPTAKAGNLENQCQMAVEMVVKTALNKLSLDNISCIFIALNNHEKLFYYSIQTIDNSTLKRILFESDKHKEHSHENVVSSAELKVDRLNLGTVGEKNKMMKSFSPGRFGFNFKNGNDVTNRAKTSRKNNSYVTNKLSNVKLTNTVLNDINDVNTIKSFKKLSFNLQKNV